MYIEKTPIVLGESDQYLEPSYRMDETQCVEYLLEQVDNNPDCAERIASHAITLLEKAKNQQSKGGLEGLMREYDLSSEEGIALLCLAESLLRIPDAKTIDKLIKDKIAKGDWEAHLGKSTSIFVNAATRGLMLSGQLLAAHAPNTSLLTKALKGLLGRSGEVVIRQALKQTMRLLSRSFVMGQSIDEAIKRAQSEQAKGYRYSFDMLGEEAVRAEDAAEYFSAYETAIERVANATANGSLAYSGISVKLSALHPRFHYAQRQRCLDELVPRLRLLALKAKAADMSLTIDAEEADRLGLMLEIFEQVFCDSELAPWDGLGLAVQAYQKRALPVIEWLRDLALKNKRRIMLRLVKGAYWDSEIKRCQQLGLAGYPVFTRKQATDVSYLLCAKLLLAHPEAFHAQFATHNAYTLATILEMSGARNDFEFQRLYGMGEYLYDPLVNADPKSIPIRVYAPVGSHHYLLSYLVRRLLENGANTSFVKHLGDSVASVAELVSDPIARLAMQVHKSHPGIVLPEDIYRDGRKSARGLDFSSRVVCQALQQALDETPDERVTAGPIIAGKDVYVGSAHEIVDPSNRLSLLGCVYEAIPEHVDQAFSIAHDAQAVWSRTPMQKRAQCLEAMADQLEKHNVALMRLLIREAGKTIINAHSEVREAVDFCRYYAQQARALMANKTVLHGPTGEYNTLAFRGRGVIVCISPWNFPLAIFLGQVAAALVAGNAVIAKPAEQTPLIAALCIRLLIEAGIPPQVCHLLPGQGSVVGAMLCRDRRVAGVIFTGSTETANKINHTLAGRSGPIVPLIAETGGQNCMIVDSSALLEKAVLDVVTSAFDSAGQRCSALRVVYVQEEIADRFIELLKGAMAELAVGDPGCLATDVGPVIDIDAQRRLEKHSMRLASQAQLIYKVNLPELLSPGTFVAPCAFALNSITQLNQEVFGPMLHVIRYPSANLDAVIDEINSTGYGLTFGLQSRIEETAQYISERVHAGNIYINRTMIGATVGVQPFGGMGLSGTGPKAGGPYYLHRLMTECSTSTDTTAMGGNAMLLSLDDDMP